MLEHLIVLYAHCVPMYIKFEIEAVTMSTHNLRFEQRSGSNRCFIPYRKKLVLMSTHNLCSEKKYGKQHNFSSQNCPF